MEKNLIDIIANSGIVGAGGAGFPTHVKMNAKAEYVIINGAECEPLLSCLLYTSKKKSRHQKNLKRKRSKRKLL